MYPQITHNRDIIPSVSTPWRVAESPIAAIMIMLTLSCTISVPRLIARQPTVNHRYSSRPSMLADKVVADDVWAGMFDDARWAALEEEDEAEQREEELSYPARALREQDFLGPGEPLQGPEPQVTQTTAAAAAAVSASGPGVVRLSGTLSLPLAEELRRFALSQLVDVLKKDFQGEAQLTQVLGGECARWDLRLPMAPVVRRALAELLNRETPLGGALELALGGPEAELWELAVLVSAPGASAQVIHGDCDEIGHLYTSFVALQPVSRCMGPTRFLPYTHADEAALDTVLTAGDVAGLGFMLDGTPPDSCVGLLDTGDATLYDGRILHCGGSNTSPPSEYSSWLCGGLEERPLETIDGVRVLFYTTFRHVDRPRFETDPDSRSLLMRYDKAVSLGMCRDDAWPGIEAPI